MGHPSRCYFLSSTSTYSASITPSSLASALRRGTRFRTRSSLRTGLCTRLRLRCVPCTSVGQFVRSLASASREPCSSRRVAAFQRLLGVGQRVLHVLRFVAGNLVAMLAQHLLDRVDHAVELVPRFDLLALRFVFRSSERRLPSPCDRLLPCSDPKTT